MARHRPAADKDAIARHLQDGLRCHQTGDYAGAETAYREVLRQNTAHPDALHHLGLIEHERGNDQEAARLVRRSLAGRSAPARWHLNLATIEQARGRHEAALKACRRAAELDFADAGIQAQLGDLLLAVGQPEHAVAAYERALAGTPGDPDLHNNRGNALAAAGRPRDALAAYDAALKSEPDHAHALANALSTSADSLNDPEGAVERLDQAIRRRPHDAELLRRRAGLLLTAGWPHRALACLPTGNDDDTVRLRVDALKDLGQVVQAAELCERRAVAADGTDRSATWWLRVGACREQLGNREAAADAYQQILEKDADSPAAWHRLTGLGALNEAQRADLEQRAPAPARCKPRQAPMLFALAREYDRADDIDRAFRAYTGANDAIAAQRPFDADALERRTDAVIDAFHSDIFADATLEPPSDTVFIVGMPRSGTTLVERMLAAHPALAAGGERSDLPWLERALARLAGTGAGAWEAVPRLTADTAHNLRKQYHERLTENLDGETRITDKLPSNYLRLGWLPLILPGARVIHCRRNPLDTLLSCYTTHFRQGQGFSYRLDGLVATYQLYERIMDHWRRVMPEAICEVDYDNLVRDPEPEVRRMLAHCGLDWDPACLAFHEQAAPVQTASAWQVRQPLNSAAVGRWRRYRKHLGPLLEAFPDAAQEDDDG